MTKWIVPYAGRDWVFDDDRITASEARLHKQITGGLTPYRGEAARVELDADAWVAALVIARRRTGMTADDAARVDADELDIVAALRATTDEAGRELDELRARVAAGEASVPDEALPTADPDAEPAPA